MKGIRITYWVTTSLLALMMAFSAFSYLTKDEMKQGFEHLGFPDYFRVELAIAKFLGVVLLLAPVAARVKEWTYAAFAIVFVSAFVAHTSVGDPVANRIGPVISLALLVASYITYHRLQTGVQNPLATVRAGR